MSFLLDTTIQLLVLCWLLVVVKLGTPQDRRLKTRQTDQMKDKRQKGDCERTKGKGEMFTLFPSFLTPHQLIRSLSFYWLKSMHKIQQNMFFITNHYFSNESFFLFPDQLCVRKRSKSLRNSVQRSLLFLCFGSPAPLVIPSCAGDDPTAHIIISVLRHFLSRCGHRACPAPRASSEPTAHIIIPVFRHFLAQCGHRACPAPVPVMSLLHSTSKLMIMA